MKCLRSRRESPPGARFCNGCGQPVAFSCPSCETRNALRLREAGMIKSSPQKIVAQGTDWRLLNELKKELKG